jgi:predicted porin
MKKALLAAVLGITAGAAMAQSSVTLYGAADVAVGKAPVIGDKKIGVQSNTIVTGNRGSLIGFKGKEDLGGGNWAGFLYEADINLGNGANEIYGRTTVPPSGFGRSAWLEIGGPWGAFTLGRNYTPNFTGQAVYLLSGWPRYSVVAAVYGYGGYAYPRNNAQIEYTTPTVAGFRAQVAYQMKGNNVVNGGDYPTATDKADQWAGNITYVQGPMKAAATINKPSYVRDGRTNNAANSTNASKPNWTIGGSYMFGKNFALSLSYNRTQGAQLWNGTNVPGAGIKNGDQRFGWELGAGFYAGPFTFIIDLTRDTKNQLYLNNKAMGKKTNGLVDIRYALSKRTYFYADYLRLDGYNNYGLGIHHDF